MKEPRKPEVPYTDPRRVQESYVNDTLGVSRAGGNLHLTLGIQRPASGAKPGDDFRVEREVIVRLVMPEATARQIAKAIELSLGPLGQVPLNRPLQS